MDLLDYWQLKNETTVYSLCYINEVLYNCVVIKIRSCFCDIMMLEMLQISSFAE